MLALILAAGTQLPVPQAHPVLRADPPSLKRAYERGRAECRHRVKLDAVARKWSRNLADSQDEQTRPFAVFLPAMAQAELDGFSDEAKHKPARTDFGQPKEPVLRFQVHLYAGPKISNGDIERQASREDVTDVKFVMEIGDHDPVEPASSPTNTFCERIQRSLVTTEVSAEGDCDFWEHPPSTRADFGTAAGIFSMFGNPAGSGTSTDYWGYLANYEVEFPLYHWQGIPRIGPRVEFLFIKVVSPRGAQRAVFKLSDFMPAK